ncbi:unnamed protein product, partial [Discosporangium mesarthrocarpum]
MIPGREDRRPIVEWSPFRSNYFALCGGFNEGIDLYRIRHGGAARRRTSASIHRDEAVVGGGSPSPSVGVGGGAVGAGVVIPGAGGRPGPGMGAQGPHLLPRGYVRVAPDARWSALEPGTYGPDIRAPPEIPLTPSSTPGSSVFGGGGGSGGG